MRRRTGSGQNRYVQSYNSNFINRQWPLATHCECAHDISIRPIQVEVTFAVSTGIGPQSLPEWAFRARPGLWWICLCPKVARIAEHKFTNRYAKLWQTSSFPNGPQIWEPTGADEHNQAIP